MKKQFLLCAFLLALVQWSNAQTVKLYSSTGVLKNTYVTIASAMSASVDGDSLLLSPHTFYESMLTAYADKYIILQGTILGKDTSTINASGNGSVIYSLLGTIRDIVITGGNCLPDKTKSTHWGGAIFAFIGKISGNTVIRNNIGLDHIISLTPVDKYPMNRISGNVKIINNRTIDTSLANSAAPIRIGGNIVIEDNVIIANNIGYASGAIYMGCNDLGDSTIVKKKSMLSISGNVTIENNEGVMYGAIICQASGNYIQIDGATVINNKVTNSAFGAAICVDTTRIGIPSTSYDSIGVPLIRLHNVRIYNPLPSGARQTEISMHNRRYTATRYKPGYFYSDACWWGNSDTTGLFKLDTGTYCSMPTWAVTQWSATPFGTALSNVRSQMKLNTGAALPSSSLSGLQANFWATAGSFSVPRATINASNYLASDYYFPTSGSYKVYAAIDADTFKPSTKALGIPYLLNNHFAFTISPNPSNGKLVINDASLRGGGTTTKQSQPTVIKVYDLLGRIVYEQNLILNKAQTPLALNLAKGTYILELRTEDAVQREWIVIAE